MGGGWPQGGQVATDSGVRRGPDELRWPDRGIQCPGGRFTLSDSKEMTLSSFTFPKDVCLLGLVWKLSETMITIMINGV